MIQIRDYARPKTLDEAMTMLHGSRNAAIIGGGAFLRLGSKNISTAIDLGELGLNEITEDAGGYTLGAMVTFGDVERSTVFKPEIARVLRESLKDIVGVQLRNTVTVGATVFSRYGFSDLISTLLALDSEVHLHQGGSMKLEAFLKTGSLGKDILTHVRIPQSGTAASYQSLRLSTGDYAVLNLALAQIEGVWRVAVGARPGRAALATETMNLLNTHSWNGDTITQAVDCIARELTYGSNARGSAEYRCKLAGALLKKAMMEVQPHADSTDR